MDPTDPPEGGRPRMNRGAAADLIGRSRLSPHGKLIALAYLSHQSSAEDPREAISWPGLSTLSEWASCSRSTAQAHRAELLRSGCLVVVETREESMRCRLDLDAVTAYTPAARVSNTRAPVEDPSEVGGIPGAGIGGAGSRQGVYREPAGGIPGAGIPIPGAGIGGAGSRHRGVPGAGTEPSSDISPQTSLLTLSSSPPQTHSVETAAPSPPRPTLPPLPEWSAKVRLPEGVSRRELVGVVLRTIARVTLRPLSPEWCAGDLQLSTADGRTIDPEAKTDASQVLGLWIGLGRPSLATFEKDAKMVAQAFHENTRPLFARNVRAQGWPEGTDRSRHVATFCVLKSWEERLRVATDDYVPF